MKELPKDIVEMLTEIANTQIEPDGDGGAMPSSEDCFDKGYGDGRVELAREVVKALGIKVTVKDPGEDDEKCEVCYEWVSDGDLEEVEGTKYDYYACSACRAKKSDHSA